MKFLCVECDQAMKLEGARGPDNGSMTVIFACPSCGKQTAMLTNSMETQMVRTLGVTIGGRAVPPEPMEMLSSSLADSVEPSYTHQSTQEEPAGESSSKCPFTGVVSDAYARTSGEIQWSAEAEARVTRIPSFARAMVRKGIEQHAREKGYQVIDDRVMDEVKGMFGM